MRIRRAALICSPVLLLIVFPFLHSKPAPFSPKTYVENLVTLQEGQFDLATVELTLEKEIDPDLEIRDYSKQIDGFVRRISAIVGNSTDPVIRIEAINRVLLQEEKFTSSFSRGERDDDARAPQLFYLLETKRGTCFSLPILFMAVAQRLGYPIYPAVVPGHCFLRYVDPDLGSLNIETTAPGMCPPDTVYIKFYNVPMDGIMSGIYMRTMTRREFLAELLGLSGLVLYRNGHYFAAMHHAEYGLKLNPLSVFCNTLLVASYRAKASETEALLNAYGFIDYKKTFAYKKCEEAMKQ